MSEYTCLLLSTPYHEKGIAEVNRQLLKWGCGDTLVRLDSRGGPMPLGAALWSVVVRKVGREQILHALRQVKWSGAPVQALVKTVDGVAWEGFIVAEDPLLGRSP